MAVPNIVFSILMRRVKSSDRRLIRPSHVDLGGLRFIEYDMKNSKIDQKVNMRLSPLTSAQIRAARALLRWTAEDLAHSSALSVATIRRAELTEEATMMTTANDLAVRRALEAAGVEFIDENGGGPGVRLRKRGQKTPLK